MVTAAQRHHAVAISCTALPYMISLSLYWLNGASCCLQDNVHVRVYTAPRPGQATGRSVGLGLLGYNMLLPF